MLGRLIFIPTLLGSFASLLAADFDVGMKALARHDYRAALAEFAPLAERGDKRAQYNMAVMYFRGDGVAQSFKDAARFYKLAAQQGNAHAQYFLGNMLDEGTGVPVNKAEAANWYRLAAEQGHPSAQLKLANAYLSGEGVAQDMKEWQKWNRRAAEQGVEIAQFALGLLYFGGADSLGIAEDHVEALKWFSLCAAGDKKCAAGHAEASKEMTVAQIAQAEQLANDWMATHNAIFGEPRILPY
jgi:TPR repeat protein